MLLSVSNIDKSFNDIPVLKNVSFHIEDHDKAAIVGINGAGKTTLLRIIMGELTPDNGIVTISRDRTVGYLSQHEAVSGENTIYDELLSVKQNIIELEQKIRSTELQMKTASEDTLNRLMNTYSDLTHAFESANGYAYKSELTGVLKGLGFTEDEFKRSIDTLSGGQKTRVALGKLLLINPDLIILDEPTNHLDMSSITWLET
ncbi:MAG: ATP-binding cassette domain-containing protein, partial [Lachnospiraceae bacterium]|nr:ATP-binding cassette domain-containing protein [Lachnospiraceae bacterium]